MRSSRPEITNEWQEAQPLYPDIKAYNYGEIFAQIEAEEEMKQQNNTKAKEV